MIPHIRRMTISLTLIIFCVSYAAGQWASLNNQNPVTSDRVFYMDSASQCSTKRFEVDKNSATILGREAVQTNPGTITECMITLTSNRPGEMRRFQVEIVRGSVSDDGVHFHMYDGQDNTGNRIFTISKGAAIDTTQKYTTSGGSVTFYLSRGSIYDANYQIELRVIVIPGDPTISDECKTGNEYGCVHYGYKQVVDKETIIGIVGGVFGLILFIVIPIIIIFCYRKGKGVNKKWDEFKLADKVNTAADIHASSASLTKSKKEMWTSQSSRAPYSDMRRSHRSRYSDGSASEYSASIDIPPKHRPPPPPYDESERRYRDERYRDDRYRDDGYRSDRFRNNRHNDDRENRYNDRVDRDYRAERNGRNRYESDRKSYYSSSDDNSFVQKRDDHPQEVFVERVIEPRVKPSTKAERQQRAKYYEDDEDTYDTIVDKESPKLRVKKKEMKESAIQADSSDEDESNTESDNEPPSTDETDEDDIIRRKEKEAKKSALYAKPNKSKKKKSENNQQPIPQQPVQGPYPIPPGGVHMVPGQPVMFNTQQPNGPMMLPRSVAPMQQPYFTQPPHPPPYPRPMMSMSGLPQQPMMGQQYPQPPMSARLPPPAQVHRPPTYSTSQNPPQQPVFTHLVQRGYGQDSVSVDGSDGGRHHTDESDVMANLGSGVEFMRRNHDESTV